MAHVVILTHRDDGFVRGSYFLREIADVWRERGLRVTVVSGPGRYVDGDVAVLHVDLTRVPDPYRELARRYRRVMNERVIDISKRRVSDQVVRPCDGYRGPVIV